MWSLYKFIGIKDAYFDAKTVASKGRNINIFKFLILKTNAFAYAKHTPLAYAKQTY